MCTARVCVARVIYIISGKSDFIYELNFQINDFHCISEVTNDEIPLMDSDHRETRGVILIVVRIQNVYMNKPPNRRV